MPTRTSRDRNRARWTATARGWPGLGRRENGRSTQPPPDWPTRPAPATRGTGRAGIDVGTPIDTRIAVIRTGEIKHSSPMGITARAGINNIGMRAMRRPEAATVFAQFERRNIGRLDAVALDQPRQPGQLDEKAVTTGAVADGGDLRRRQTAFDRNPDKDKHPQQDAGHRQTEPDPVGSPPPLGAPCRQARRYPLCHGLTLKSRYRSACPRHVAAIEPEDRIRLAPVGTAEIETLAPLGVSMPSAGSSSVIARRGIPRSGAPVGRSSEVALVSPAALSERIRLHLSAI